VSLRAYEWATKFEGLTRLQRTLLKEIGNRYNEEKGRAWPSQSRLARDTGYSRSSINRGLNELEEKGLLIRVASYDTGTQARTSNRYFLPMFAPQDVPETRRAIGIERYFDEDGRPDVDEFQDLQPPRWAQFLHLKTPSDIP
jgi:DNA-binding transcriptional MocR family regulator